MTPSLTPRPDHPLEPTAAAETTSTQLFGVLYITLTGLVDSVVPNSRPWSLLVQYVSYIIKLAPILWWALPAGSAAPHPKPSNTSTYDWLPDIYFLLFWSLNLKPDSKYFLKAPLAPDLENVGPSPQICDFDCVPGSNAPKDYYSSSLRGLVLLSLLYGGQFSSINE
ncbi:hypothetical protein DSO57_1007571 [Entomophthora muscae]|uniref:Uncharacterized protein n=1 Tax=Entomophthora muscae TaxID=34485 RepID=A0ACC2S924_9FUNG|nr:hypothetical protein DSO57_1007571 [Entomophthora muscae]